MLHSFFVFLLESSICLLLFAVFYKIVLQKETFFGWNRFYLLASLILSVLIPLVNIPILENENPLTFNMPLLQTDGVSENQVFQNSSYVLFTKQTNFNLQYVLLYFITAIYFMVAIFKMVQFIRKLVNIQFLISSNTKTKEQHYWIVTIQNSLPAFSFFRYIFINKNLKKIDKNKFEIIKKHESIHASQMHSLDNILTELLLILFWFNPIMYFCKQSLHEIHEYIVDEKLTQISGNKIEYSHLLLNLAIQRVNISPFLGFSAIKIKKRLQMLNKQKSNVVKKISYILTLPLIVLSFLSFSVSKQQPAINSISVQDYKKTEKLIVGNITWEGNTIYSDEELSKNLGLKPGDIYNHDIQNRLWGSTPVVNMFMDKGYVFYNATFEEKIDDGIVDITINIYEGNRSVIGVIDVSGNKKISKQKVLDKVTIKEWDFFNRTAIIKSVNAIQSINGINIDGNDVRVLPQENILTDEGFAIINLDFVVSEK